MPFIQPTQSRTITDYRSSCRVNSEAKTDADTKTDGAYRHYLQNNAVESRDARVAHVPIQPYFKTGIHRVENPDLCKYKKPQ